MQKLTKEQAVVISGFTGILVGSFSDFHGDLEKRMGRPVFTHEMGGKDFMRQVKDIYLPDFIAMQP